MKAYVINLDNRSDRWESVLRQSQNIPMQVIRIPATESKNFFFESPSYLPPPVLACFDSHKRALMEFLKSEDDFALVLEDDFFMKSNFTKIDFQKLMGEGFDFLQIGYLKTTIFQSVSIWNKNSFDLFYKVGSTFLHRKLPLKLKKLIISKKLLTEQIGTSWNIVLNDIRPGAHAYIVSRKFALSMKYINSPTFLSADGLYIALGPLRTFKMGRLRKSVVEQTNSPSSILIKVKPSSSS